MLEDLDQVFAWLLANLIRPTSGLYGEYDLRPGDRDPAPGLPARYGGQERPELTDATHVRDLHRDLRELGFLLAARDATTFTTATWQTVMEFQRYASLPDAAVEREPGAAVLAEGVRADALVLRAGPAGALPDEPPFRVRIDEEILEVTAVGPRVGGGAQGRPGASAVELSVSRGVEGTSAAVHVQGAGVELVRWSDRLLPAQARFYERYAEPITGVVNPWTRFVLRRWKERGQRCPVVVEAWELREGQPDRIHTIPASGGRPARRADNVWGHREVTSTAPRFYVRDLTGTWPRPSRPPVAPAHPELDVTGDYRVLGDWSGPRSWPELGHTWRPEAEMLPEHLLPATTASGPQGGGSPTSGYSTGGATVGDSGSSPTRQSGTGPSSTEGSGIEGSGPAPSGAEHDSPGPSGAERSGTGPNATWSSDAGPSSAGSSGAGEGRLGPTLRELVESGDRAVLGTYKVVRAVSEVEAVGYFDGLNAYDRAFLSLGPCHWTAGLASDPAPAGPVEGSELWGFVSFLKEMDRLAYAQVFGRFGVDAATGWGQNGADLFNPSQRKYTSRPTVAMEDGGRRELGTVEEYDMFRSWHWFYRVQMAARTADGFRRAMWHMARLRIRDVGETPWDGPAGAPTWTVPDPRAPGGARPARIKDVITSERGMAIVYRWHIRAPANMVSAGPATEPPDTRRIGRAGSVLRAVYDAAAGEDGSLFAGTPDTWGDAAERALVGQLRRQGGASVDYVHEWPRLVSASRGFTLPYELLPEAADGGGRRLALGRNSFELDTRDLPLPAL